MSFSRVTIALAGNALPIGFSTAAKAALFIIISVSAYKNLPSEQAVTLFQVFFAQSVIITFLSSAGYFGAFSKGADSRSDVLRIIVHVLLGAVGIACVMIAMALGFYPDMRLEVIMLLVGAVATGISSPLIGMIARERGSWIAFGPAVPLAIAAGAFVWFSPSSGIWFYCAAIAAYQVAILLVLVTQSSDFCEYYRELVKAENHKDAAVSFLRTMMFGIMNTTTIGTAFLVRQCWSETVDAETAASVFFLFRIGDTALQLLVMALAPFNPADKVVELAADKYAFMMLFVYIVAMSSLVLLSKFHMSLLVFTIASQIVVEIVRVPSSAAYAYQMLHLSVKKYVVYVAASSVGGVLLIVLTNSTGMTTGYHMASITMAALGVAITLSQSRLATRHKSLKEEL